MNSRRPKPALKALAAPTLVVWMDRRPWSWWALALLLLLPIMVSLALQMGGQVHKGNLPTAFVQYDQPSYMANAREHFDHGFTASYGLAYDWDRETPRIFFQPQTLVLGIAHHLTGWQPGWILAGFGLLFGWLMIRIALAIYRQLVPLDSPGAWLAMPLLIWGGGALAVTGLLTASGASLGQAVVSLDPGSGLWFLNLGRNLLYPLEAYYHALSLGLVLLTWRKHYWAGLLVMLLLCASHPMTGIQMLLVIWAWGLGERVFFRQEGPPWLWIFLLTVLAGVHLWYYRFFLMGFDVFRAMHESWLQPWLLSPVSALVAYGPVALLVVIRFADRRFTNPLSGSRDRLLLVWFLGSLALAKHEWIMDPVQPLHFTRGYVWTPLFLLGVPVLVRVFDALWTGARSWFRPLALAGICLFALSDNLLWFAYWNAKGLTKKTPGVAGLTASEQAVFTALNEPQFQGRLLLSHDAKLAFLSQTFTPVRSWYGHLFNTPAFGLRREEISQFYASGELLPEWENRPLVVVLTPSAKALSARLGDAAWTQHVISEDHSLWTSPLTPDNETGDNP